MYAKPNNYSIYPSVVKADEKTVITIVPNERAFLLFEGEDYELTIVNCQADVTDYHNVPPSANTRMTVKASDGIIRFEYTFEGEMEHYVILKRNDALVQQFSLYSLYPDLYELTPLKGDLHTHSFRSDGKRDPAALFGHFREQGFDFIALTDHNRFFPGGEIDEVYSGVNTGMFRVYGEEVHYPGNTVHIVHVGGKKSVTEQYIKHKDKTDKEVESLLASVPDSVPEKYKLRYAMCRWACDKIHEAGGIAIFPHPNWKPGLSMTYNVVDEFAFILLKSGMFDAFELCGGSTQAENNMQIAEWTELIAQGCKIKVVGSSDVHAIASSLFATRFTLCFASSRDNDAVANAVRRGMTISCETACEGKELETRCYGSYRLVMYGQFLFSNYFPEYTRICEGGGTAMRALAMEQAPAKLVELLAEQARAFSDRFFGRTQAPLPSKKMLEFEDKWRKTQIEEGPNSKGSSINIAVPNMQL